MNIFDIDSYLTEKWSEKYKRSIDCSHPRGFSQRAHCQSVKKKRTNENIEHRVDPDEILTKLCAMIIRGQEEDADRYGMVASAIIDPQGNIVYGINLPAPEGKRRHAERVALDKYKRDHGDVPAGSRCITTLSPCNRPMGERSGEDCWDMLKHAGITDIYCGYMDPSQAHESSVSVTDNPKIKKLCKEFADTFLTESCRYGQYYCSTDKKLKCRQGPKQKRQVKESIDIESFLPYVIKELGIKHLPKIEIVDQVPGTDGKTFGRYDPEKETVYVVSQGRHERDVMRTLAHELVHYQQDQEQRLNHDSGATGSSEENEANARAGIILRNYNNAEPMKEDSDPEFKKQITIKAEPTDMGGATVRAFLGTEELGFARFRPLRDGTYKVTFAMVYDRWQRKGIATMIYNYARDQLGYKIVPSDTQSDDAKAFWKDKQLWEETIDENFADGKHPGRKGLAKRMGVPTKASVSRLRDIAKHSSGEKARMAHWMANMKSGHKKK